MKILIVKTVPGEIDISKITYNHQEIGLARALIKRGHYCNIICCANGTPTIHEMQIDDNNEIKLYCVKAFKILKNGFLFAKEKIFNEYDVLHVSEYNQLFTWYLAKKYKHKMIIYHGPYYSDFNKRYNLMSKVFDIFFLERYIKLQTNFITKSDLATEYLQNKGISKVKTIGVGIDLDSLNDSEKAEVDFATLIKNNNSEYKLLYVGRIEPRRNPMFLLDVFNLLKKRKVDVSLIIVGTGDSDYVNSFFSKAKELGLMDFILYKDKIEQKYLSQIYVLSDVFLLPTIYDIFGMVLLEAMYFGCTVITTVNGGSNKLIENGENGFVIGEFNIKSWADCVETILKDKVMHSSVSKYAKETVLNNNTWDALVDYFLLAYENKLNKI